ncbi:ATP-binding protein [Roseateles sp. PN1]|uniref:ATP-binding protein n=1 Tax=Roseateles sp. PN1 TaxID=3137372 RepID=UPI003139EB76
MTATSHLALWQLRSALALILDASPRLASPEELMERHPVLHLYVNQAARAGFEGLELHEALAQLDAQLLSMPPQAPPGLPLERLRSALALDAPALSGFLLCAWIADEPELAPLAEALGGHEGRCTRALLPGLDAALDRLIEGGYLQELMQGRRRVLEMPPAIWTALRGQALSPWRHTPSEALPDWAQLILPEALREAAMRPANGACWALRGVPGSGRRALAGAIARASGLGLLEGPMDDPALPALATLLGAMPLLSTDPAPGQRQTLPDWPGYAGPIAVKLPRHGGLDAEHRHLRWLELTPPDAAERELHWRAALGRAPAMPALAELRLPRGRIHTLAAQVPDIDRRPGALMAELEAAGRFMLDGTARRMPPLGEAETLALGDELQQEFDALLARCRHRERLRGVLPAAFGHGGGDGVRALFKGPSGTGKTLAARHLAATLGRPLYRVDLAATVSKYIGETERNLERVFEAAEALDIVLLLDEGDALMAGRTSVNNANDRYANLETNYLLQRLESFDGVLVVTTNAAERIDSAFARRMDLTLDFALPDALLRHGLWQAHLPPRHVVSSAALDEIARRCPLSGGQIRNAALHAALLGLQHEGSVGNGELLSALQREYRRAGQHCPSLSVQH